jgi:hypothetical protein
MTEFVGGVLGVGDLGADFFVVLPPGPFLTFFRLVYGALVGVLGAVKERVDLHSR